jgi:hypothetical protein
VHTNSCDSGKVCCSKNGGSCVTSCDDCTGNHVCTP